MKLPQRSATDLVWACLFAGVLIANVMTGSAGQRWPAIDIGSHGFVNALALRQSLERLPAFGTIRQLGHSFRVQFGFRPAWAIEQAGSPPTLFFVDEMLVGTGLTDANVNLVTRAAAKIAAVAGHLDAAGYKLIVVPVPTKLSIEAEFVRWPISLWKAPYSPMVELAQDRTYQVYEFLRIQLEEKGVPIVDLNSAFKRYKAQNPGVRLFPPGESHWNQLGILVAARETARAVARLVSIPLQGTPRLHTRVVRFEADIARGYDVSPLWLGPLTSVHAFDDSVITRVDGVDSLARNRLAVIVTGTSYSGQYWGVPDTTADFPHLAGALVGGALVVNGAHAGKGSHFSMERFLDNPESLQGVAGTRQAEKRVIVWEFPVRDIASIADLLNVKPLRLPAHGDLFPVQVVDAASNSASMEGFSTKESWGTWTDGPRATVQFDSPLPLRFTLAMSARAFGLNMTQPFTIRCGDDTHILRVDSFDLNHYELVCDNAAGAKTIEILVPAAIPASKLVPNSPDSRSLGLGVASMRITPR